MRPKYDSWMMTTFIKHAHIIANLSKLYDKAFRWSKTKTE